VVDKFYAEEIPAMFVVCVHVHVKPEHRTAFINASLANARNTLQEPGNLQFDVLQQGDDPDRFVLYEVYRDEEGMKAHKATAHYAAWAGAVTPWMAAPRHGIRYNRINPNRPTIPPGSGGVF
jgi:(4S)-4-hydroxy-5-phosphonooxypentane-2,3-dione isomerase